MNTLIQYWALASDISFLLVQTMGGSGDGSRNWVSDIHMRDIN